MLPIQFCPNCKQKNKETATECVYCGSPIAPSSSTTQRVTANGQITNAKEPTITVDIPQNAFALLIPAPGKDPYTLIEDRPSVILGRPTTPGQTQPDLLDLTPYNAASFGVSRHHVAITKTETGYAIEDMGSVNGTWLNRLRLIPGKKYPLKNNDEFRMGRLWLSFHYKTKTGELPGNHTAVDTDKLE